MLDAGEYLKSVVEVVDHKDYYTTVEIYKETSNKSRRKAVSALSYDR